MHVVLYNAYKAYAPSVDVLWKERRDVEDNLIRVTSQIKELIAAKECYGSDECKIMIEYLCTS